jgi:predicted metal-dependent peptidase
LPYLATALYSLITVPTNAVAALACDQRWRLYVNPAWLVIAPVPEVARAIVHQTWHLLADHSRRAGSMQIRRATAPAWRTATDLTVAQVVPWTDAALPNPRGLRVPGDRSAEEYFAMLSGLPEHGAEGQDDAVEAGPGGIEGSCGSACDGLARRYEVPVGSGVPAVDEQVARTLRIQTATAFRDHCRAAGITPGRWDRWVAAILDPVAPWPQVLNAAVRRGLGWAHGRTDTTYARISRRQAALPGVVLPAYRRPVPAVAIIIDTSASVDDHMLGQALGEVDAVLRSLAVPGGSVTMLAVDAAVQAGARIRDVRSVPLPGGGGTDMREGLAAAQRTTPRPHLVIVLTDGYTPWPSTPPGVPVIIGVLGSDGEHLPVTPDWAQRVEVVSAA